MNGITAMESALNSAARVQEVTHAIAAQLVSAGDDLRNGLQILEMAEQYQSDDEIRDAMRAAARRCRRALASIEAVSR